MLDLKYVRNNIDFLKKYFRYRVVEIDLDKFVSLYDERIELIQKSEELKNKKNIISSQIAQGADKREEASLLSKEIKELERRLFDVEAEVKEIAMNMPNVCDPDVPLARDESGNKVIRRHLELADGQDHVHVLGSLYEGKRASKISGSRFIVLRGRAAKLERTLANFMLDYNISKGYEEFSVPQLVKSKSMYNSGQLPKFKDDAYSFEDMYLIPTGEVSLVNVYASELFEAEQLTKKMVALTHCFRKESGSYGRDTRGLIRVHQFLKVELFKIAKPEDSEEELELLVNDAEDILKALELPYRVVLKCTGDTSFTAAKTYDLEVWMPAQNKYREISSCSNTRDFQSRRAGIKFRRDYKSYFPHLLNGSGLAVGRTLAAMLENHGFDKTEEILKKLKERHGLL